MSKSQNPPADLRRDSGSSAVMLQQCTQGLTCLHSVESFSESVLPSAANFGYKPGSRRILADVVKGGVLVCFLLLLCAMQ